MLLAFAVERRAAALLLLGARLPPLSIDSAGVHTALSSKPAARRACG